MKRCLSLVKLFLFRDWFEDELRAFQGGKDGLMPCVWENEVSSFPQVLIIFSLLFDSLFVILFSVKIHCALFTQIRFVFSIGI